MLAIHLAVVVAFFVLVGWAAVKLQAEITSSYSVPTVVQFLRFIRALFILGSFVTSCLIGNTGVLL